MLQWLIVVVQARLVYYLSLFAYACKICQKQTVSLSLKYICIAGKQLELYNVQVRDTQKSSLY